MFADRILIGKFIICFGSYVNFSRALSTALQLDRTLDATRSNRVKFLSCKLACKSHNSTLLLFVIIIRCIHYFWQMIPRQLATNQY